MKKKIYIDSSIILRPKTGVGAYVLTLYKVLNLKDIDFTEIYLNLSKKCKFKQIIHLIWLNTVFYLKTLFIKPDILVYPNFFMPFFTREKTKYIVVIHDLASFAMGFDLVDKYTYFLFKFGINTAVKKADFIITVSETVKQELIKKFNVEADRIKVVYNSIAEHFINTEDKQEILDKYGIEKNKYIFSVATLNKRKNIPELTKAFESISNKYPDLKLVLAGGMGNEQKERLTKNSNVIFTGYIPDEELPVLYKNALMYVFPSVYEGFGTPQIESQYCGCPLLCSDIPVFREVSGNGAEFCEPTAKSIAEKTEYLITNPERREELIKSGYENVKRFDIDKIAEQLMEVINA